MAYEIVRDDVLQWCDSYTGPQFHALLADVPYELDFMHGAGASKKWDDTGVSFQPETWRKLRRHLLPGAFLFVFGGTLNDDLISVAMREAGLRKHHKAALAWVNGMGMPKCANIPALLDQRAGVQGDVVGYGSNGTGRMNIRNCAAGYRPGEYSDGQDGVPVRAPATPEAQTWAGYRYGGQFLKPALEPVLIFQVPYEGKALDSITRYGAGAANIAGGRLGTGQEVPGGGRSWGATPGTHEGWQRPAHANYQPSQAHKLGRWPASFLVQHTAECRLVGHKEPMAEMQRRVVGSNDATCNTYGHYRLGRSGVTPAEPELELYECAENCPVRLVQEQAAERGSAESQRFFFNGDWALEVAEQIAQADPFFYNGKASVFERNAGVGGPKWNGTDRPNGRGLNNNAVDLRNGNERKPVMHENSHPCLKPLAVTKWLASILLPPGEYAPRRCLVPFAGTGSEMVGALLAGFEHVVGIEAEERYCAIARQRVAFWLQQNGSTQEIVEQAVAAKLGWKQESLFDGI